MKPVKLSDNFLRWSLVFLDLVAIAVSGYVIAASLLALDGKCLFKRFDVVSASERLVAEEGLDNDLESTLLTNAALFILTGILALSALWPACKVYGPPILALFLVLNVMLHPRHRRTQSSRLSSWPSSLVLLSSSQPSSIWPGTSSSRRALWLNVRFS